MVVTNRAIDWRRAQATNPAFSREEMAATEGAQLNWARRGMPRQIHYAPIISTRPDLAASPRLDMLGKFCLYKKPVVFEVSPSFLLNPIPEVRLLNGPYLKYKSYWWRFTKDRIEQFIKIKEKYVNNL